MRKVLIVVGVLALLALGFTVATATPSVESRPWSPEGVEVWFVEGYGLFVTDYDSEGGAHTTRYCLCEGTELECPECQQCESCSECEQCENCEECQECPSPTPQPEKEKCNSGRGNDSEGDPDCDPGNSGGHNQGGD